MLSRLPNAGRQTTVAHRLARITHMIQQRGRTVYCIAFLIPRDGKDNRPVRGRVRDKIHSSSSKGGCFLYLEKFQIVILIGIILQYDQIIRMALTNGCYLQII